MLENAWKEEHERQKLHEFELAEQRRIESLERESSKSTTESSPSSVSSHSMIRESQVEGVVVDQGLRLSPKTIKAKAFHSTHNSTHIKSRSLDSSAHPHNDQFKPHALHHITRIVPPQPLASTSNQRLGHRHTVSESHNSIPMNSDLHDIYTSRRDSSEQELGDRGRSIETIPLAAFDHTLPPLPSIERQALAATLREPSFLALPESQASFNFKKDLVERKSLKSTYEVCWDSNLPGFKLFKKDRQQPNLVARIPKLITGWKMVMVEPKDENLVRHEVADSRKDVSIIECEKLLMIMLSALD